MKQKSIYTLLISAALLLGGCGGGSGDDAEDLVSQAAALETIIDYAKSDDDQPPKVEDYQEAGISSVDESNLDIVNAYAYYYFEENPDATIEEFVEALTNALEEDKDLGDDDGDTIPAAFDDYPENAKPTAESSTVTTEVNTSITLNLSAEDRDGDTLAYHIVVYPVHGTLDENTLLYTPDTNYYGTDSLIYKACEVSGDQQCSDEASITITIKQKIDISDTTYTAVSLGKGTIGDTTINIGTYAKDLYLVLSNHTSDSASASVTRNSKISTVSQKQSVIPATPPATPKVQKAPERIRAFAKASKQYLHPSSTKTAKILAQPSSIKRDVVGDRERFYLEADTSVYTDATARKVISVSTLYGTKTLSIWVSDDSFDSGDGCEKATCVTQEMVDGFAASFLTEGEDNDIYDWVTNIYGEEWGSDARAKYDNLIPAEDEITILLTDIDKDNSPNGGVIGYSYSKDCFERSSVSGSNERIMLYADSVMFANLDSGDYWQKELYSTLAHELQHMIHYYRRYVISEVETDTWMEEMMSETTEDLIATKIDHIGPRGVDPDDGSAGDPGNPNGRYPYFNQYNTLSLTTWYGRYGDYGKVSAFGAFLVRNYGGAKVLHDIMFDNEHADYHAIEAATGVSFSEILSTWGTAVMLSDIVDPEQSIPTYNTGDFLYDTYGNSTYALGSINCFNYDPQPTLQTDDGTVAAEGNYYYKIGENLTGTVSLDLDLGDDTEAILIAKESE